MNRKCRSFLAAVLFILTSALSFYAGRRSAPDLVIRLDNPKVTVTESLTPAGGRRDPYVRPTDQLIIFLDDAEYEAIDAGGEKALRRRKSGEVVWHARGETAPLLVNTGKAYRNLIVALK